MARGPAQVVANTAEIRLFWVVGGQLAVNVRHASHGGSVVFNQTLADTLGGAIKAAFTAQVAAHMATTTQLVRVGVRSLSAANQQEWRDQGAPVAGTAVGDAMPSQIAQCITLRTPFAGKSGRGRQYLSGWAETVNDANGRQSQTASTAGLNFMNAIGDALSASSLIACVLIKPKYEVIIEKHTFPPTGPEVVERLSHQLASPGGFNQITAYESRNLFWENQRRRSNNRGAVPTLVEVAGRIPVTPR